MLEPPKAAEFIDWPLHVTIVPWFACDNEDKVDGILKQVANNYKKFKIFVAGLKYFGRAGSDKLAVNLVEPTKPINDLHQDVLQSLERAGFYIHQKDYVGKNYKAHITHQGGRFKEKGDKLGVDSFSLIKQVRQKNTGIMVKSVVKDYALR